MKEFANNLKKLRKERNLSQRQLADMSSIPIKTIQNYEQDRNGNAPTFHNVLLLADFFDVSPYNLYFGGRKEMTTNSLYMDELLSELKQLDDAAIKEIHDSEATGTCLPKFSISSPFINELANTWNNGNLPKTKRKFYRNYIEQTITRYAQNRQKWKKTFNLK